MNDIIKRIARAVRGRILPPRKVALSERYPQYQFGRGTYGDLAVLSWGEGTTLTVGNYTSIASGAKVLLGGEHRLDWVTTFPFSVLWETARGHQGHPRSKGDVRIGSDVWIGAEALIMSGVTIADGAVVGAGAVVTRNVAPYAVVAGNPAKQIKLRFDQVHIRRLLALEWWSWDEARIRKAIPDLLSSDIQYFLDRAERGDYQ